jgi:5-methylthioadenosine/S-adenosylhomocysteine deaminase
MPGLINTHAHVAMVLFRGLAEDVAFRPWFNDYIWPLEHNLTEGDVHIGSLIGMAESLMGGVTTVNDHYFNMDEAAHAVAALGIRAMLGWAVFGSGGATMLKRAEQFALEWRGAASGRILTAMAPHAPYTCSDDFLRASAKIAQRHALPIHIHAAETLEQTQASLQRTGLTPIQVLERTGVLSAQTILAHACGVMDGDLERIAASGAGVSQCTKTYLKLGMEVAPVVAMRQAGIPVGVGTDGAASNNTLDVWESMRLMALIQKQQAHSGEAMPIAQVIYAATRGGAHALGLGDCLGALEPGFLADLILLDLGALHHQPLHDIGASLVYNTQPAEVHTVIVDGRVVVQNRRLLTLDIGPVLAEASAARQRLSRRGQERIQTYSD